MRRFLSLSFGALFLASVAVASSGGATQAEARWVITDLGRGEAVGINDQSQVVGYAESEGGHAFLWEHGERRDLGTLGGYWINDIAINDRGQVAGWDETKGGLGRAFLWEKGKMRNLDTLPSREESRAVALNDEGQVVGYAGDDPPRDGHAFLWENGKMLDLGTFGGPGSWAVAINDQGQVVGYSESAPGGYGYRRGFLFEEGTMRKLGTLGGPGSWPVATTNNGQVVGYAYTKAYKKNQYGVRIYVQHAFLWQDGNMRDLGALSDESGCLRDLMGCRSEAVAINDRGQVVGNSVTGAKKKSGFAAYHAFLWENGKMRDLGTLGGEESTAVAINNQGQVVGYAETKVRLKRTNSLLRHAFAWVDGKMLDLGTLPGGKQSEGVAINSRGQVVGWSETKNGKRHAVLWTLKR